MKAVSLITIALVSTIVVAFALILPNAKKHVAAIPIITISTANEKPVNPYLFGADAPNWRDSDPQDTALTNKIISIAPTILMTPENGIRCNFAHWKNPRGYGFDSTELLQIKGSIGGPPLCLKDMTAKAYQARNYTTCFDSLNSLLKARVIYSANIVTGTVDEATDYVKKYHPSMVLLGVELYLRNAEPLFPSVQDFINKAKPFSEAVKQIDPNIKVIIQIPYPRPGGAPRDVSTGVEWDKAFKQDMSWYDYIALYNWNQTATSLNTEQPIENVFNDGKDGENSFFDDLTETYDYFQKNFPGKKIVVEQWGINDSKKSNNGSVFGNTMLFALHIGRYCSWLASAQNDNVAAAVFGGYLACSYAPTTAIYAPRVKGNQLRSDYYETTVSIALNMMSDAFHGTSLVENTSVSGGTDLYAQSFQKNRKHYLYIENYSNTPRAIKININSLSASSTAAMEELYGQHLYSSAGWAMWQQNYTYEKATSSEVTHDAKQVNAGNVTVQPYSFNKLIF